MKINQFVFLGFVSLVFCSCLPRFKENIPEKEIVFSGGFKINWNKNYEIFEDKNTIFDNFIFTDRDEWGALMGRYTAQIKRDCGL
jgi:hypothetical protein